MNLFLTTKFKTASRKSTVALFFLFAIILAVFVGCSDQSSEINIMPAFDESINLSPSQSQSAQATTSPKKLPVYSLSSSSNQGTNAENGGYATLYESTIYYIQNGIFSMSLSGENIEQISDISEAIFLNKCENNIYYISTNDYSVYRFNLNDPDDIVRIGLDGAYSLSIVNGYLYYQNAIGPDADLCLYRANVYGTSPENMGIRSSSFCISGQNIYYADLDDKNTLYVYDIKSGQADKLSNNSVRQLNIVDNCIYYVNRTTNQITKLDLETSESTVIYDRECTYLNNNGTLLVFSDNTGLYTMDFSGENIQCILTYNDINGLNVVGDFVFFESYISSVSDNIFSLKTDGSTISEPLPVDTMALVIEYNPEARTIVLDFVEYFTGDAAVTAYTEDFAVSESQARQDLADADLTYIRNTNTKQRIYSIFDITDITLTVKSDGSYQPEGYAANCDTLNLIYQSNNDLILNQLFYINAFEDRLLSLEQVYRPISD